MLYVERFISRAFQSFFRGIRRLLIFEWANLHAIELVFLRRLYVGHEMLFLQAAGNRQCIILFRQCRHLQ